MLASVVNPLICAAQTQPADPSSEAVQSENAASQADTERYGKVIWSNSFDTPVEVTGQYAKYWVDGKGPKGFLDTWVPEKPVDGQFMLKLDSTEKVDGDYSLYCKSTAVPVTKQRVLLSYNFPEKMDYTQSYILRAKVKAVNASHSNWGGAALRAGVDGGSVTGERLLGTFDWKTVELKLDDLVSASGGKTSGNLGVTIAYEYFSGEIWFDDLELISTGYKFTLDQETAQVDVGSTVQLTAEGAPEELTVTWTSSDPAVATVDENGVVTGVGSGFATITARADEEHSASCLVVVNDPQSAQDFQAMRNKWSDRLTGNPYWQGENTSAEYRQVLEANDQAVDQILQQLVLNDDKVLFSDLKLEKPDNPYSTDTNDSAPFATAVTRVKNMAIAWASQGSAYYHQDDLRDKILYALEWNYSHFYNESLNNRAMFGNWWHWWIGIPQDLAGTLILMHDELSEEMLAKQGATLAHFNEDPKYVYQVLGANGNKAETTGANLADTSLASVLRGAATDDALAVVNGVKYFDQIVCVVEDGDGIYADGSFIQHENLAYTGGYGSTLLGGTEKLIYMVNGTPWSIASEQCDALYNWIWDGVRPLYADGAIFDMVSGRGISRPGNSDYTRGRGILTSLALLSESAPEEMKAPLRSFLKAQLAAGIDYMGEEEYFRGMNIASVMAARQILEDESIVPQDNANYAHVFGSMDRAVAHGENFSLGISYSSTRTGRFEFGNDENKLGWHQGDGVLYMYNGDPSQYADNYWNTVDPQRLAGTTTDHSTWPIKAWGNYLGNGDFNGGSAVGPYASVAMDFKNYATSNNPNLAAHKTWFVFGDQVIALGAGIEGIDSTRTTETIVENKKINGDNQLLVDGEQTAPAMGDSAQLEDVSWAWLDGNTDADAMGYYFPETSRVNVLREQRTGSWRDINGTWDTSSESEKKVTRSYLSLAVPHDESSSSYSYVLLPGKTSEETAQYAQNNSLSILSNTKDIQAAADTALGVSGYIFWQAGSVEAPGSKTVTASQPMTMTMVEDSGVIEVGISDPSQKNPTTTVRIEGKNLTVGSCSDGVSAEADENGVTITVDTSAAYGQTFTAQILDPNQSIEDTLDRTEEFLRGSVTTQDRDTAQSLLEELAALIELDLTEEQSAKREQLDQQLRQLLADMDAVNAAVEPLSGIDAVDENNADEVRALLAACDALSEQQKKLFSQQQKETVDAVRAMLEAYDGLQPTPTPAPTQAPQPSPDPTEQPATDGGSTAEQLPATGDSFPWVMLFSIVCAACAGVFVLRSQRAKQ